MRSRKKIIVVGAGLGGLAAAAYLAKQGHSVDVFEKNDIVGGRCATIQRKGFRFDLGATLFLMHGSFQRAFSALGERMEDHLDLIRVDPASTVHFPDRTSIDMTADLLRLREGVERFEPGTFGQAVRYLQYGYSCYQSALHSLINKDFRHWYQFFTPKNLALFVRIGALSDHYRTVAKLFTDERLRAAFSYHSLYVGCNPFGAPGMYAMLPALEIMEGLYYPRGGMAAIAQAFHRIGRTLGVRYHCGAAVDSIDRKRGGVSGVRIGKRSYAADAVVVNADAPYAYRELLGETTRRFRYSCSAYTFYWGLRKKLSGIQHQHNVIVSDDYRGALNTVFNRNSFAPHGHFYANFPSRTDSSAAPRGGDSIMVIVPCGHTAAGGRDWRSEQAQARSWVLRRLSDFGMPDIEDHIAYEMALTPKDWESSINLTGGAVFGSLDHSLLQMGYFRCRNRHPSLRNLYFVGGSIAPGSGLPMVVIGAKLTADRIADEVGCV